MKVLKYGKINDIPKGWVSQSDVNKKLHRMWNSMFSRCYNTENDSYQYYGARGVTICDDWKLLSNFVSWALSTPNYSEFENSIDNIKWSLDKDIKIPGSKEYSPDTCSLVPLKDNIIFEQTKTLDCSPIVAIKDGKSYRFNNIYECADFINGEVRQIRYVLNPNIQRNTYKGYSFKEVKSC